MLEKITLKYFNYFRVDEILVYSINTIGMNGMFEDCN